jgi:hypothetical protein
VIGVRVGIYDQAYVLSLDIIPFHSAEQAIEAALLELVHYVPWIYQDVGAIATKDISEEVAVTIIAPPSPYIAV